MAKLGMNVQPRNLPASAKTRLYELGHRLPLRSYTVIAEAKEALSLATEFPQAFVKIRFMWPFSDSDASLHTRWTPVEFLNNVQGEWDRQTGGAAWPDNLYIYTLNEPQPPHSPECVNWVATVVRLGAQIGRRICALNYSVGTLLPPGADKLPDPSDGLDVYEPLFNALAALRGYSHLGIHEYAMHHPLAPDEYLWRCGSHLRIATHRQRRGLPMFDIGVDEALFDGPLVADSTGKRQQYYSIRPQIERLDAAGQDGQIVLADRWADGQIQLYEEVDHILYVEPFTYGYDYPDWFHHNIVPYVRFQERLIERIQIHDRDKVQPLPDPDPVPEPEPDPMPELQNARPVTLTFLPAGELNFRKEPSTSARTLAILKSNMTINVEAGPSYTHVGIYDWYRAELEGFIGWFALVNHMRTDPPLPLPVNEPEPAPEPEPQPEPEPEPVPDQDDIPTDPVGDIATELSLLRRFLNRMFLWFQKVVGIWE